ncbi:hypothetical protein GLOTRDRAFT_79497 [Gloeophyllum trabeum ATCC 11539]|uniref:P-loop containing nucleoside triphosphate hydrolase protein n=1 Tax=Gloeophyllum trabeum (strain ATCC 11539 / FP-39264 / Madison 617) TaxID=670483 RepID=S7RL32_GLOTA|nr:uncharacterized protein GLOTRDRAFT_79497 [Gloeophyllum trabeum ATCC 11539]EPQ53379.1 hypothetical protein GLOTRDRAFT_79497 [Gloeophyllum trabeum ATCC 11539]
MLSLAAFERVYRIQSVLELPRIAVIGGQSAGKSSLVEAISGIKVPRDSGTCTRCPMECTLSSTQGAWSCQISLRFDYNAKGERSTPDTRSFSPLLTDKAEVEIWLRRAQAAILNPQSDPNAFHSWSREKIREAGKNDSAMLKFSKNVVCVDICDPEATDLSFVDLPGLIQVGEGIEIIKGLVEEYIQGEKTFILVTIPASDDIQNQQALLLAKTADPEGKRTLGVITKPDTVLPGQTGLMERWKKVLQGDAEDHPLTHGYFCVRLSDDQERTQVLTRAQSIQRAQQFFESKSPWKEISDRSRLGIPGLVSYASDLLLQCMEEGLPKLRTDVAKLLADYLSKLSKLPPRLSDPGVELLALIINFSTDLEASVHGKCDDKTFVRRNRAAYHYFEEAIRSTVPQFTQYGGMNLTAVRRVIEEYAFSLLQPVAMLTAVHRETAWELPFNIPYDAKKRLIKRFIKLWHEPTKRCFDSVWQSLTDHTTDLLKTHFGQFKALEVHMRQLVFELMEEVKRLALEFVTETLESDNLYYTDNIHYFSETRETWLRQYRAAGRPPVHHNPIIVARALQELQNAGYGALSAEDLERLYPPNPEFEEEITVMADVRAYFQVAYKRIIDDMPQNIENKLNKAVSAQMQRRLLERTGIASGKADSETLTRLLDEDPAVTAKREELKKRVEQVRQIQKRLREFVV